MAVTEIKRFGNFILRKIEGVGANDTPYEELDVKPIGLAEKHVIDIELNYRGVYPFNGEPVKYMYDDVEVKHGMRMKKDTLAETKEYIDVLNEALDVAFEVQKYCILNGWWKG